MTCLFDADGLERLAADAYPWRPAALHHRLADHALFSLEALAALADAHPRDRIEFNKADLGVTQDPATTPPNGLGPGETVRTIETNGSWMVIKNAERDADYARLMADCLDELEAATEAATGAPHRAECFIFLSSPRSVTPFHMDPEHNVLCQLRGTKTMRIYPRGLVDQERLEAFHAGAHRNLVHEAGYDARAERFDLAAGDAVYVPVTAPHWVQNGEAVSVSVSITWRSRESVGEADLLRANGWLRRRGFHPAPPGGPLDGPKRSAYRALRRVGLAS